MRDIIKVMVRIIQIVIRRIRAAIIIGIITSVMVIMV